LIAEFKIDESEEIVYAGFVDDIGPKYILLVTVN
jgi:hypothetical protein